MASWNYCELFRFDRIEATWDWSCAAWPTQMLTALRVHRNNLLNRKFSVWKRWTPSGELKARGVEHDTRILIGESNERVDESLQTEIGFVEQVVQFSDGLLRLPIDKRFVMRGECDLASSVSSSSWQLLLFAQWPTQRTPIDSLAIVSFNFTPADLVSLFAFDSKRST